MPTDAGDVTDVLESCHIIALNFVLLLECKHVESSVNRKHKFSIAILYMNEFFDFFFDVASIVSSIFVF